MNRLLRTRRLRAIPAALLTAAVLLPYSGPGVCSMLGRMGHGSEMAAPTTDVSVAAVDGSEAMCCSMTGCGVTHAGPVAVAVADLPEVPTRERVRTIAPRHMPRIFPPPLPPPPQA